MRLELATGQLLEAQADLVVLPVGPFLTFEPDWGARLAAAGWTSLEPMLQDYLESRQLTVARPGTVVPSGELPGGPRVLCLVLADVFGDASAETLYRGLSDVLEHAGSLAANSLAMPPLTTTNGALALDDLAWVLDKLDLGARPPHEGRLLVVCPSAEEQAALAGLLQRD